MERRQRKVADARKIEKRIHNDLFIENLKLKDELALLRKEVEALRKRAEIAENEVRELNGTNRKPTGRKLGAQSGHKGHSACRLLPTTEPVIIPAPKEFLENPDLYPTGKKIKKQLIDIHLHFTVTDYVLTAREYEMNPPDKEYMDGFNLQKRLRSYKSNHLYFLNHPHISYTNNLSERYLRKFKRKQKQAVVLRSDTGGQYICDALTILETARIHHKNIFDTARTAFSTKNFAN